METKKIEHQISIEAPAEKVWKVLWDKDLYKKWASAFMDGSYYEGEIQEGNKIKFLSPDKCGMLSKVVKCDENKEVLFNHIAEIKNGIETDSLNGLKEHYLLNEDNGITTLKAESDMPVEDFEEMNNAMKKALESIKILSEK